jgi:hypothetical protein
MKIGFACYFQLLSQFEIEFLYFAHDLPETPTTTLYVALGFDACLYRDKLKCNEGHPHKLVAA